MGRSSFLIYAMNLFKMGAIPGFSTIPVFCAHFEKVHCVSHICKDFKHKGPGPGPGPLHAMHLLKMGPGPSF